MARHFDGLSDKIDAGTAPINSLIDFTFTCWVLGDTWNGAVKLFMSNGQLGNGTFQWAGWNGSRFTTTMDGSGVFSTATAGAAAGTWYHLAATLDSSNNNELLYVNGVAQGTPQASGFSTLGNLGANDDFKMGCGVNSNVFLDGSLADVAVFSGKLSAGQISNLAAGRRANNVGGSLLRYWPLQGIASPEPDLSGNGFNGTVTGTTLASDPPQLDPLGGALPPPLTNLLFV